MDATFGARLKEERKRLSLTQRDLGGIGGVEANAQAVYERGTRKPKADYLWAIWLGGVDIHYVLTAERTCLPSELLSDQETEIIRHYRSLGEQDQCAVAQILSSISPG